MARIGGLALGLSHRAGSRCGHRATLRAKMSPGVHGDGGISLWPSWDITAIPGSRLLLGQHKHPWGPYPALGKLIDVGYHSQPRDTSAIPRTPLSHVSHDGHLWDAVINSRTPRMILRCYTFPSIQLGGWVCWAMALAMAEPFRLRSEGAFWVTFPMDLHGWAQVGN